MGNDDWFLMRKLHLGVNHQKCYDESTLNILIPLRFNQKIDAL